MIKIIKQTRDEQNNYHSFNDEPAIEFSDGDKVWYHHGELHRENGPAVIHSNGTKYRYHYGKIHRENGSTIKFGDGGKEWWYHGQKCSFIEWLKLVSLSEEQKMELLLSHEY